jgi:hypothetical protein
MTQLTYVHMLQYCNCYFFPFDKTFGDKEVFQSLFGKSRYQHDTSTKPKPKGHDCRSNFCFSLLKCCLSDFIFLLTCFPVGGETRRKA